jgi:hypothetical protein
MPRFTILIGLALVVVSVVFVLITKTASVTAWIPAMLGGLLALLGWWAGRGGGGLALGGIRVVALIGFGVTVWRLWKGGFDLTSHVQQAQAITAALCLVVLLRSLRR